MMPLLVFDATNTKASATWQAVCGAGDFWYSSMSPHRIPPAAQRDD